MDALEHAALSPSGRPLDEVTHTDLMQGIDIDEGEETPEEAHVSDHPTPSHPTGRLNP